MKTIIGIAFLHLTILASQALYMYLSNIDQLKKRRYLYLVALPIVTAVPIAMNAENPSAYNLYEYAILFCFFAAAVLDVCIASGFDRSYMTDENIQSFHYSYFMICTAVVFIENLSIAFKGIFATVLIGLIVWLIVVKKNSIKSLTKAIPITIIALACSWATCVTLFKAK